MTKSTASGLVKHLYWDEENRLKLFCDHEKAGCYLYDAGGERYLKIQATHVLQLINGRPLINGYNADGQTLYVNPFMVLTNQGYTKHFYIEGERITSKIGAGLLSPMYVLNDTATPTYLLWHPPYVGFNSDSTLTGFDLQNASDYIYKTQDINEMLDRDLDSINEGPYLSFSALLSPVISTALQQNNFETQWYFYHPDHLGSSTYISDRYGLPEQHLEYFPFGETFVEESRGIYNTPYRFSAKELDGESGLIYFGARYYDPQKSFFYGVDPLSDDSPGWSGYNYCLNNPIVLVDPDGMSAWHPDGDGNVVADLHDNAITLSDYLGTSFGEANKMFSNLSNWDGGTNSSGIASVEGHTLTISDVGLKIGNIAEYNLGSTAWNYDVRKGDFPAQSNKCNVFVSDVATKAGASPGNPNVTNPGWSKLPFINKKYGPPFASQWADPRYNIPGWTVLGTNETPRRGDVAAYKYSYSDASGHSAIVTGFGYTIGTSGSNNGISKTKFGFDPTLSHNVPIIFRRYKGK
jgi:RHS repeat-associated protein